MGESQNNVHKSQAFFEEKGEPKRNRTEVLLLTSLSPYRLAKLDHDQWLGWLGLTYAALKAYLPNRSCCVSCLSFPADLIISRTPSSPPPQPSLSLSFTWTAEVWGAKKMKYYGVCCSCVSVYERARVWVCVCARARRFLFSLLGRSQLHYLTVSNEP